MNRPHVVPADWSKALSLPGAAVAGPRADDPPVTTLGDVLATVTRRKRWLSVWLLACLAVAIWYLHVTPPEYVAASSVILEPRRQTATGEGISGTYPTMLDSAQTESQIQVIKSERILAAVFDLLDLRRSTELADARPGLKDRVMAMLGLAAKPGAFDQDDPEAGARLRAFLAFTNRVGVRRIGQSYVLEVSYRAGSASMAARIANAVTSAYILAQIDAKAAAAHNGAEYLQGRISDIKAEQEAALDGVRRGQIPTVQFPDADVRVIGAALRPLGKSSPQTLLVIAFALSSGLLAGLLVIAVSHALDRTLRTRAQIRSALGVDCLGVLPDASRTRDTRAARRKPALGRAVLTAPNSRLAHAVRAARTAIMLQFEGTGGHAVGFVSWSHGEGRTLLACNIAHLMSVSGNPVELIDGDFIRPALTRQLAPDSAIGLSEILADRASLALLKRLRLSPSLNFLPAVGGQGVGSPNAFIGASWMKDLMSSLTAERDVVIDLPPLSASSEAQALCHKLDGVVLVVEANRTRVDEALDALRVLRAAKANVLGVVLNKADAGEMLKA